MGKATGAGSTSYQRRVTPVSSILDVMESHRRHRPDRCKLAPHWEGHGSERELAPSWKDRTSRRLFFLPCRLLGRAYEVSKLATKTRQPRLNSCSAFVCTESHAKSCVKRIKN